MGGRRAYVVIENPPVDSLHFVPQDDGVLYRMPVVLLPPTNFLEATRRIEPPRRVIRFANFEVDVPRAAPLALEHRAGKQHRPNPPPSRRLAHREVCNLSFIRREPRHNIACERAACDPRD